jgi:hypothetical protein
VAVMGASSFGLRKACGPPLKARPGSVSVAIPG